MGENHGRYAMKKISVIIPAYIQNGEQANNLETVLFQLRRSKKPHHEIIIINDGSPYQFSVTKDDDTELVSIGDGITFIDCANNRGVAAARNLGLSLCADTDYVAFVDADDRVGDVFWLVLDDYANSGDNADIYYFKCRCEDGSITYHEPCAWGKLVKRSYIGERKFDEKQLIGEEDTLFLPLAEARPPKVVYAKECIYNYRYSANPDSLMKRFWRGEIQRRKD